MKRKCHRMSTEAWTRAEAKMEPRRTYRQFGKCRLVMCEKPKRTEAASHPTVSLLVDCERRFCSRPRKRSSSGQAVKTRMAAESGRKDFHSAILGEYEMK